MEEDPNGFIDEFYKTLAIIGLTSTDKEDIDQYQLKYLYNDLYEQ